MSQVPFKVRAALVLPTAQISGALLASQAGAPGLAAIAVGTAAAVAVGLPMAAREHRTEAAQEGR